MGCPWTWPSAGLGACFGQPVERKSGRQGTSRLGRLRELAGTNAPTPDSVKTNGVRRVYIATVKQISNRQRH